MRHITGERRQTHGLFKTLKVQPVYTLSINTKSAPHMTLVIVQLFHALNEKDLFNKKIVYSSNVS
jgi:hypothetical protein